MASRPILSDEEFFNRNGSAAHIEELYFSEFLFKRIALGVSPQCACMASVQPIARAASPPLIRNNDLLTAVSSSKPRSPRWAYKELSQKQTPPGVSNKREAPWTACSLLLPSRARHEYRGGISTPRQPTSPASPPDSRLSRPQRQQAARSPRTSSQVRFKAYLFLAKPQKSRHLIFSSTS